MTVQTYLVQEGKKKCLHVGSAASPSCGEGTGVTDCKGSSDSGCFITPKRQRPPQMAHVHLCWPSHTWVGGGSRTRQGAAAQARVWLGVGALGLQVGREGSGGCSPVYSPEPDPRPTRQGYLLSW